MYQALRSLGVPTELVIYPGQFHGLKKPSYIIDRFKRYLDWYGRWLFSARSAAGDGLQLQRFDSSFRYLTIANE